MAAAAPSPLASSMEKTNGAKLSRLLIDGGTTVLRKAFDSFHAPANLASHLNSSYSILNNLLRRRILNKHQWNKLFPPGGAAPDSQSFDITLLFLLLTNICGLSPPPSGWHTKPPTSDTSLEANLARMKFFRNVLYGHVSSTTVDTPTFSALWQEITLPLIALGLDQTEIDRLKAENGGEGDYLDALFEWADSEKDIKSQLNEMAAGLEQVKEVLDSLKERREKERRDEVLRNLPKLEFKGDIENYVQRFQAGTREWVFNRVQNWLDDRSSPNRVMVISGNAGMGKSVIAAVICQRMQEAGRLSGNHFCQHNNVRYRNPQLMLQSLACQLSHALPEYKQALVEQLSRNLGTDLNNMGVEELFALLLKEPLSALGDPRSNMLMVIDGLDESEYQGRNELLDVISNQFCKLPSWICFLVTTRPATNITEKLKHLKPFYLDPEGEKNVQDIRTVLQKRLQHIIKPKDVETVVQNLVFKCEGLMLYAHFLILAIEENPSVLNKEDLDGSRPLGISSVYHSYFKRLEGELLREVNVKEENFLNLLCVITASREPLPIYFVSNLLIPGEHSPLANRRLLKALGTVSSLLPIRDGCLHFIHKSVKDWLTDSSFYGEHDFNIEEEQGHRILARLCTAELDDLKRKGVHNVQFSATEKYALYHGARHMFHVCKETRRDRLEELTKAYVTDLELLYAKLCVSSTVAVVDMIWFQTREVFSLLSEDIQILVNTLRNLLRKYNVRFASHPYLLLQNMLDEGGAVLSGEASNLLQNKYPEIPYMEYIHRASQQGRVLVRFQCSGKVVCFDVSPKLDHMVCECNNGMLQLWSLQTGSLLWTRPVKVPKSFELVGRQLPSSSALSFYRSVVFHPTEDLVLPGILSHAYTIDGDLKPLFVQSSCRFSVCSVSGDKTKILTDCLDDAKCLLMWSLENGAEIARITRDEDVLSFAWSQDGTLLAISHSTGSICLVDVMSDFTIIAQTTTLNVCGILKFSPDNTYLFCWCTEERLVRVNISVREQSRVLLVVSSREESCNLCDPKQFDSPSDCGFLLGDRIPLGVNFVLDRHTVLKAPLLVTGFIEMLSTNELAKNSEPPFTEVIEIVLSSDGETVYVVTGEWIRVTLIMAFDVSSGKLIGEKNTRSTRDICLVSVTEGVLLLTSEGTLELSRFDLSKCVRRWTKLSGIRKVIPISEEQVACVTREEVIVWDTTNGKILTTIPALHGDVMACNSKLQIITTDLFGSWQLSDGTSVFWEKEFSFGLRFLSLYGFFSPNEKFVIIGEFCQFFILDVISGNTLLTLEGKFANFLSDDECVVVNRSSVELYNLKSSELISVVDVEDNVSCLAVCPSKRLFTIGFLYSNPIYNVIRVWLPGDKDRGKSKSGKDNTVDTVHTKKLKQRKRSKRCVLM